MPIPSASSRGFSDDGRWKLLFRRSASAWGSRLSDIGQLWRFREPLRCCWDSSRWLRCSTLSPSLTAAPVSIDPCVVAFGHETVFEGSEIEGACRRRRRQTQAGGRQDLLGVDANHKALAQEEEGEQGRGARTDPRQARKERGDAQGVVAEAPGGQRRPYPRRTPRGFRERFGEAVSTSTVGRAIARLPDGGWPLKKRAH